MKLNAKQLRKSKKTEVGEGQLKARNEVYVILDNVLDTYNIGSVFRLADAAGVKKIYLCGDTNTPPNPRIKKSSINTTEWVDWEYFETTQEAIIKLRQEVSGIQIVVVEQSDRSIPYTEFEYKTPIALIVGHETYGVSQEVINGADGADGVVELPMFGVNVSLNVMVSLAIVLYKALEKVS